MWFKEYTFNLIIQPFHLILYTVLVGTAINLATESLVYAVVAIYFLTPAEKLLRKFFGFDNAGTLSAAGSFAGGALFSAMINKMNRPKPQDKDDDGDKSKNQRRNAKYGSVSDPTQEIFGRTITSTRKRTDGSGGARTEHGGGPRRKWRTSDLVQVTLVVAMMMVQAGALDGAGGPGGAGGSGRSRNIFWKRLWARNTRLNRRRPLGSFIWTP